MVKGNFMLIAVALVAIVFLASQLGLAGTGSFISTTTLSVSQASINGIDKTLVVMTAGSQADTLIAELSKSLYPDKFNSPNTYQITATREGGTYAYTLTDVGGSSGTISTYELASSCNGWAPFGSCNPLDFGQFKAACKNMNVNSFYYDSGDLANPAWRCYGLKPKYLVSKFDSISGSYSPAIKVYVDEYVAGGDITAQYPATLTNAHTYDVLTYGGKTIGTVAMVGLLGTFQTPPSASGIMAVRPAGQTTGYMVVPSSAYTDYQNARDDFQMCIIQAEKAGAAQVSIQPPGFPFGFSFGEKMNDAAMQTCISAYNSAIAILPYAFPTGDFGLLDVSKINQEKKVYLKDTFSIPEIKFELESAKIGIVRPIAVPTSASCINKELPGSATVGDIVASVTNGGTAGTMYVETNCDAPYSVTTPGQMYYFNAYETKQLSMGLSLSPDAQTKTCRVIAKSGDLASQVTGSCTIKQTVVCTNTPKPGFYLDKWCNEYCALTINDCPTPNVLKTPSTGYPNLCICEAPRPCVGNECPQACNNNGICETGETIENCRSDCWKPDNNKTSCLPVVQKLHTEAIGQTCILGVCFGGTTVQSCVWDFPILAAALLVLAGALLLMKKEKYAKVVGIVGLLLLVLSFVADNATLLALGGMGIFLIALVAVAAYVALRLHLI